MHAAIRTFSGVLLSVLSISLLAQQEPPVARVVATVSQTPIVAESIVHDAITDTYFVSSPTTRVVFAVKDGQSREFLDPRAGALGGMALHAASRTLWVCSNVSKLAKAYMRGEEKEHAEVLAIDINTAKVRQAISFPRPEQAHFCDSVTVDTSGNLFITDAGQNAICVLTKGKAAMSKCVETYGRVYPQGVVLINTTRLLVAGYAAGIGELDVVEETWRKVPSPPETDLRGIDGLSGYKNCLIGIRNNEKPAKVLIMHLSPRKNTIDAVIRVRTEPTDLDEPTWGTVVGDRFVFIGNSQGETFAKSGPQSLQPTMLLEFQIPASCAE